MANIVHSIDSQSVREPAPRVAPWTTALVSTVLIIHTCSKL